MSRPHFEFRDSHSYATFWTLEARHLFTHMRVEEGYGLSRTGPGPDRARETWFLHYIQLKKKFGPQTSSSSSCTRGNLPHLLSLQHT